MVYSRYISYIRIVEQGPYQGPAVWTVGSWSVRVITALWALLGVLELSSALCGTFHSPRFAIGASLDA